MSPLALVAAIARNDAIGHQGKLPWDFPDDRAHFRAKTIGHAVIMGRRTFEETGAALPDRRNIVVSRTLTAQPDVEIVATLTEAIELARTDDDEPRVIGGRAIFAEAMPLVTRAFVTRLPVAPEADTFFHFDATRFDLVSSEVSASGCVFEEWLLTQ